jgi:type IV secretory pathway VirB2 component (pilin)
MDGSLSSILVVVGMVVLGWNDFVGELGWGVEM